ncbi:hypothetical protein A2U01_0066682, partial [Trifolium medium]|nr:hypothetical protein [Trifolium medium]
MDSSSPLPITTVPATTAAAATIYGRNPITTTHST